MDARDSEVIAFWFDELAPKQWWKRDPDVDATITARFADLHAAAARCETVVWRARATGRLAEIIVLDQFSRNLYRDDPRAYAWDAQALVLAQEAVSAGADLLLPPKQRPFLYMPYMHSESALIHAQALELFDVPGLEDSLRSEREHKAILDRFGRYPARNAALGRDSTPEEVAFLARR